MKDRFSVENKVVLITGSSRGLGKTLASGFVEAGAKVIINGRDPHTVHSTSEELASEKGAVYPCPFDVSDPEQVSDAVAKAEDHFGRIGVLINNAAIQHREPLPDLTVDKWRSIIDTNLSSAFYVAKAVVPGMIKRNVGRIINISSLNSIGSRPTIAHYCTAKAGLNGLTRSMAIEYGRYGIRANAIAPGYFITEMTAPLAEDAEFDAWVKSEVPLGRWGDPDELIGVALFLASSASDYVNGHVLVVDGGWIAGL